MSDILVPVATFLLGGVGAAVLLARLWLKRMQDPELARQALKGLYRAAHPHWLQNEADERVCPCCGWNETEGLASDQKCEGHRTR